MSDSPIVHELSQSIQIDRQVGKSEEEWERYEGPRGGEGWQNTTTGEVRYVDAKPTSGTEETGGDDGGDSHGNRREEGVAGKSAEEVLSIPAPGRSGDDPYGFSREEWQPFHDAESEVLEAVVEKLESSQADTREGGFENYQHEKRIRFLNTILWKRDDASKRIDDMNNFHRHDGAGVTMPTVQKWTKRLLSDLDAHTAATIMANIPQGIHNDYVEKRSTAGQYGEGRVSIDSEPKTTVPHEFGHALFDNLGMSGNWPVQNNFDEHNSRYREFEFAVDFNGPEGGDEQRIYETAVEAFEEATDVILDDPQGVSDYSFKNGDEFLAETFEEWVRSPERLDFFHPKLKSVYDDVFGQSGGEQ